LFCPEYRQLSKNRVVELAANGRREESLLCFYAISTHDCCFGTLIAGGGYEHEEKSMKIASTVARYLLGLVFLAAELNGFLNFIPQPPFTGVAAQFFGALFMSRYYVVIFLLQIVPAVLLLATRYVPLSLTILAAIVVNIPCFHIFMAPAGLPPALVVTVLWFVTASTVRPAFAGILQR
jgi:putative oxidoreductase